MAEQPLSPPEPSDEALMLRLVQRDVQAFTALYDRYAQAVYVLAVHLLGRTEAEEVVQDVFLRLWSRAEQFDAGRTHFRPWFMAIARHRILDEFRRRSQEQQWRQAEAIDRLLGEVRAPGADLDESVWQRERDSAVLRALQSLPAEQRQVLVLAYFGGLSHTAMAQRLGWPLGTVKKRLQLGFQKLRALLAAQGLGKDPHSGPSDAGGR